MLFVWRIMRATLVYARQCRRDGLSLQPDGAGDNEGTSSNGTRHEEQRRGWEGHAAGERFGGGCADFSKSVSVFLHRGIVSCLCEMGLCPVPCRADRCVVSSFNDVRFTRLAKLWVRSYGVFPRKCDRRASGGYFLPSRRTTPGSQSHAYGSTVLRCSILLCAVFLWRSVVDVFPWCNSMKYHAGRCV